MTQPDNPKADLLHAAAALLADENCSSADVGTLPGGQRVLVGDKAALRRMVERHNTTETRDAMTNTTNTAAQAAPVVAASKLSDEQITAVWNELDGDKNWLRTFGYLQFAHAVLAAATHAASAPVEPPAFTDEMNHQANHIRNDIERDDMEGMWKAMWRAAALAAPAVWQPAEGGCKWAQHSDEGGGWRTACGEDWYFVDGGPAENGMKHCHNCGKPVVLPAAPTQAEAG